MEASGKPRPIVEWYRNGDIMKSNARRKIRGERDASVLQISQALNEDGGEYCVVASNEAGEASSMCQV